MRAVGIWQGRTVGGTAVGRPAVPCCGAAAMRDAGWRP